jgi:hypothetical protein
MDQDIDAFDQITMIECDGAPVMEAKHTFLAYPIVEINQTSGAHVLKYSFLPQPVIGVDPRICIPSLCKQLVGTFN